MNKNRKHGFILIAVVIFIFLVIKMIRKNTISELETKGISTTAYVYFCSRGNQSRGPYIKYKYIVDSEEYTKTFSVYESNYCDYKGRKFELRYLESNPSKATIDLSKEVIEPLSSSSNE